MKYKIKLLSLSVCASLGTATMISAPTPSFAGIIPDGDYQIQINVTPFTTSYLYPSYEAACIASSGASYCTVTNSYDFGSKTRGWQSSFTTGGNIPGGTSKEMSDNDVLSGGVWGSGIAGDGRAGTIDISVSGDTISIDDKAAIGFQIDTLTYTVLGNWAQFVNQSPTGMSGTVDALGNMTFTPTGRLAHYDGPLNPPDEIRWNVDDVTTPGNTAWSPFTTGTVTTTWGSITGAQVANVGPTLNGDGLDDFTATLVQASIMGTDNAHLKGNPVLEVWNVNIVSVSAVPIPAALWLFGSGLLGLIGLSRRKKTA